MAKRDYSGMLIHPYTKKKQAPSSKYEHRIKYDFLSYTRLVMKWVTSNYELTRPEVELLLFLYGQGTFSQRQFFDYHTTLGIYQIKGFKKFQKDGWIKQFRERKGKECALYILTTKGQRLCSRMHKMCAGEEEIPTTARANKMAKSGKPIDKFYLEAIKKMNRHRREE